MLREVERAAGVAFRDVGMQAVAEDEPLSVEELAVFQRDARAWVATDDQDRPVGYLIAEVVDGGGYVEQVSVHPTHARQGLGRVLLDAAAAWAWSQGLCALMLTTFAHVPWNAPYYGRLGFRVMAPQELSEGLCRIRAVEAARGLDAWPRVTMCRPVAGRLTGHCGWPPRPLRGLCELRNPVNRVVLARAGQLQAPDWWLTAAGAVFQTVWNVLDGRDPAAGIGDYDLFYFDDHRPVLGRRKMLSSAGPRTCSGPRRNRRSPQRSPGSISGMSSTSACQPSSSPAAARPSTTSRRPPVATQLPRTSSGGCRPTPRTAMTTFGYDNLFDQRLRPNPRLASREVYERKADRWVEERPRLRVDPWPASLSQ